MKKTLYLLSVLFTSLIVSCGGDDDPIPAPVVVTPEVVIPDTGAPTITLVGSSTINIEEGDSYTDAGASASDEVDGDISSSITTSGSVDASTPGTYTLTYSVSDAAGNSVELTRTIIVAVATKITALAATGRVSEQTPAEARSTINGKWNFPCFQKHEPPLVAIINPLTMANFLHVNRLEASSEARAIAEYLRTL